MRKVIPLVLSVAVLAGCAGSKQLQTDALTTPLTGKTLAVRTGKVGKLIAHTPGKAVLSQGMIGGLLVDAASEDIAKKYGVPDPAKRVAEELAKKLETRHGVVRAANGNDADLMLEVKTTFWDINYGPVQWASYAPVMQARAELKDARTGRKLASGNCVFITAQTPRRGLDELLANNAAQLKRDFETLAHKCAEEIGAKML